MEDAGGGRGWGWESRYGRGEVRERGGVGRGGRGGGERGGRE